MGVSGQQIFDMLMESQFWSPAQMQDYQRSQLAQLLHHAKNHVPFYKTRLDCVLRRDGSIDWDSWPEIPIVTRSDLRDHAKEMRATLIPDSHGGVTVISSSGSTGVPITVHKTEFGAMVASQIWNRFYNLNNIDHADVWADFRVIPEERKSQPSQIIKMRKLESDYPLHAIPKVASYAERLKLLGSISTDILLDMPNHAEILAHENLRADRPVSLKAIIGIGMATSKEQIALYAESFGAKTFSPYSSKEGGLIAFPCAHGPSHLHVNSEALFFESVDKNGRAVVAGETGRAIITPLFSTAQPLIRYEQGDTVVMGKNLKCGITLPVITEIQGRSDAIFRFPGRDFALVSLNVVLLQESLQADAFQIAQTAPSKLEVRYVAQSDAKLPEQKKVASHLKSLIDLDVKISFRRLKEIPHNAGGKQNRIVREFEIS